VNSKYIIKNHTNTFLIRGHEYEVTAPAKFNRSTGELIDDKTLDDVALEIANEKYRQAMGIVSPADIKRYRTRVNLSQQELASLMGRHPATIELYEAGAFPAEADNRLLRALINDDATIVRK
jgi:DNA-binding transcriptional regulator YiaG